MSTAYARLILIFGLVVIWEAFVRLGSTSPILVSPPTEIIVHIGRIFTGYTTVPDFYANAKITVLEIMAAYGITLGLGLFIGAVVAASKLMGDAFMPILLVFFAIPKIILYPIIFLMVGTEMMPKIVFGALVGIFSVIFNTAAGLRQVDKIYITLAQAVGLGKVEIFFKVVLPAAAPTILSGMRLGFGYTIIGVVVGELLVVNAGLGYLIDWASFQYFTPQLYALIIITLSIGIVGNYFFTMLEKTLIK